MGPKGIFPNTPLSLSSIKLGRLVLNTRYPQQDYIDPITEPPEFTKNTLHSFEEIRSSARASNIRARIAGLLSLSFESRNEYLVDFSAAKSFTYLLNNSKAWFNRACGTAESRKWIEDAIEKDHRIYLVVGYHTLVDARVTERATVAGTGAVQGEVQVTGVVPAVGVLNLSSDIGGGGGRGHKHQRAFVTAGEQIYAVQYRKVQFNWYSSRSVETAFLEPNNRWKPCMGVRGEEEEEGVDDVVEAEIMGDGTEEGEDEDEDEDDEDEDEDEGEDEEGVDHLKKTDKNREKYVTGDGETEFVF